MLVCRVNRGGQSRGFEEGESHEETTERIQTRMNMIAQPLIAELDHELAGTRKILERIPADKFEFRLHSKSGSLIWLAHHVATIFDWGYDTLSTPSLSLDDFTPPPLPATTEALIGDFENSSGKYREALARASDADLMHVWTMTWKGQQMISMPRVAVLRGMIMNHLIHHRGQLTMYLRALDIPVPGLYGPSADEARLGAGA